MREIAARDANGAPPKLLRCCRNRLTEHGVCMRGQSRNANADKFSRSVPQVFTQEEERYHRPVIECRILFPKRTRGNVTRTCRRGERSHKINIVFNPDGDLRMSKRGKIPLCRLSRRNMEEIIVCRRVRTDDDDGIGTQLRRRAHNLMICPNSRRDLLLPPRANRRDKERWMRYGIGGKDGHYDHSP